MQIDLFGNRVAIIPFEYGTSGSIDVLNLDAGNGYDFNESDHFPRVGIVISVSSNRIVEDEYRIINNILQVGDEVLFTHDAIIPEEHITFEQQKAYIIPITSIYAIKRDGLVFACSDAVICSKEEKTDFLGQILETNYISEYASIPMSYKEEFNFNGEHVINKGDRLVLSTEPYMLENEMHFKFFDKPMYAVSRYEILGINNEEAIR